MCFGNQVLIFYFLRIFRDIALSLPSQDLADCKAMFVNSLRPSQNHLFVGIFKFVFLTKSYLYDIHWHLFLKVQYTDLKTLFDWMWMMVKPVEVYMHYSASMSFGNSLLILETMHYLRAPCTSNHCWPYGVVDLFQWCYIGLFTPESILCYFQLNHLRRTSVKL